MIPDQPDIEQILHDKKIIAVYQPIVDLHNGSVFGYEALSRFPEAGYGWWDPEKVFAAAREQHRLWQLDYLCRSMAILNAAPILAEQQTLFLNVDANILEDQEFHQGTTAKFLSDRALPADHIIFEVSEKVSIEDYAKFSQILENYHVQKYRIAIDDVGSGYSGLNLLARIEPQFIKLDIGLVQGIHRNHKQKAIVKALVDYAAATQIRTIAEGIEEWDELALLMELGVDYAQGYLLGYPQEQPGPVAAEISQRIRAFQQRMQMIQYGTIQSMQIGMLATKQKVFSPQTKGKDILAYFSESGEDVEDVVILDGDVPVGIISRYSFSQKLATPYGISLYSDRPVRLLMNKTPLVVEYDISIEKASELALNRQACSAYDAMIIVKEKSYYGVVTIRTLLENTTKLKIDQARHESPLTGLPGNNIIERMLQENLNCAVPFSLIYIDLDNFKVYNDIYGFEAGDKVLIACAEILKRTMFQYASQYFLGHIGGDDFIAIIHETDIRQLCERIIDVFDQEMPQMYSQKHRHDGWVMAKNRHGEIECYPLLSISLAVLNIPGNSRLTPTLLGERAALLKKRAKNVTRSCFVMEDPLALTAVGD